MLRNLSRALSVLVRDDRHLHPSANLRPHCQPGRLDLHLPEFPAQETNVYPSGPDARPHFYAPDGGGREWVPIPLCACAFICFQKILSTSCGKAGWIRVSFGFRESRAQIPIA